MVSRPMNEADMLENFNRSRCRVIVRECEIAREMKVYKLTGDPYCGLESWSKIDHLEYCPYRRPPVMYQFKERQR